MTSPESRDESFRNALLQSAADDGPAPAALDRELARLGLATVAGTAALTAASGATAKVGGPSVVEPTSRLAYTFEWDGMPGHVMLDDMTLEDLGDGRTRAVIHSTAMAAEDLAGMMASGMEDGMNASYAALDRVLDAMGAGTSASANTPTKDAPATVRPATARCARSPPAR